MLSLILSLSMLDVTPKLAATPVQPCVWPNLCKTVEVAQFKPCVWPNTCAQTSLQQFQPCVWPKTCG